MPENTPNRGYPVPVASDAFEPQSKINALGQAVDADVESIASSLSTVATTGDYDDLSGKPTLGTAAATDASAYATAAQGAKADTAVQPGDLATVATSGAYNDLSGKPTLGTAAATDASAYATAAQGATADTAVQPGDLATVATSGAYNDLTGKPTLGTAAATDASAYATAAQGAKADAALPATSLGNLLMPNAANGCENGTTLGFSVFGGGPTLAASTDNPLQGSYSLKVTHAGTGVNIIGAATVSAVSLQNGYVGVSPGETMHAEYWLSTTDTSSSWTLRVYFYTSAGVFLSLQQSAAVNGAVAYQPIQRDFTVPVSASFALVAAFRASGVDGAVSYLDVFGCWRGAGGTWRPTGQDIADANTRVKPTDSAIVQLYNPAAAAWVDAAASSSVVYGTTAGTAAEGNDARILAAIPDTTVDAKGDLLVGTADDTVGRLAVGTDGQVLTAASGETSGLEWTTPFSGDYDDLTDKRVEIGLACSDETTALTTGTAKVTFRMPYAMTLTSVRASVTTAPVGAALTVDINESGSSVLSTKLTIDGGEKTSTTAATAAVISDSALADDAEITIDIDQVGSSTAGAGLKVWLIGTRA